MENAVIRLRLLTLSLSALLILAATNVQSQTTAAVVPPQIAAILDQHYQGWVLASLSKADRECEDYKSSPPLSVVRADFNGDGKLDYAIQIIHRNNAVLLGYLNSGSSYRENVLFSRKSRDGLGSVIRRIPKSKVTHPVDALTVTGCGGLGEEIWFDHGRLKRRSEVD